MNDYFTLTENGIILNDESIMLIPEYNEVYKRDKSQDKSTAFKEFHYIFQMCDIRSSSVKRGLKGKQLVEDSKKVAKLPIDWKADNLISQCLIIYRTDRSNIIITSYQNLLGAFGTANQTIEFLDDVLRSKIDAVRNNPNGVDGNGNTLLDSTTLQLITSSIQELLKLGTSVPKMIQELNELKGKALSSNKEVIIGRGGIEITDSMNPTNSIANR